MYFRMVSAFLVAAFCYTVLVYHLYILKCAGGTLYTGITTDPKRRLTEHNTSRRGAKYTRARRPVVIVYTKRFRTHARAAQAEARMKSFSRAEKQRLVRGQRAGVKPVG